MANIELRAQRRAVTGKKVRFLRREGLLPASLYGPKVQSVALQLPARETEHALRRIGSSTLVPLMVDGEPMRRVLVREIQRHPTSEEVLHIDLFAVAMDTTMRAAVPLHFVGEAPAVTQLDGTLVHSLDSVEVDALPMDLPSRLDVDLSLLESLHSSIHASDLHIPAGVTLITSPDALIATVSPPRLAAEEMPEAEAAPAAAAEAPPEAAPTAEATEAEAES
jgi:large subunit ribosomal protein L25